MDNNIKKVNKEESLESTKTHEIHKFVKFSISVEEIESFYSRKFVRKITRYRCFCGIEESIARQVDDPDLLFDVFYSETIKDSKSFSKQQ